MLCFIPPKFQFKLENFFKNSEQTAQLSIPSIHVHSPTHDVTDVQVCTDKIVPESSLGMIVWTLLLQAVENTNNVHGITLHNF